MIAGLQSKALNKVPEYSKWSINCGNYNYKSISPYQIFIKSLEEGELRVLFFLGRYFTLNHTPIPFCFSYFEDRVLYFCPGSASDLGSPPYAFWIAGISGMYHNAQLVFGNGASLTFCPGWH
jgi:hypothetical protein